MFGEVPGESTLPEVGAVVKAVVLVEVVGDVGHTQEDEKEPGSGPEQPSALVLVAPLLGPSQQVLNERRDSLMDVHGGRQVVGSTVGGVMFLRGVGAVGAWERCVGRRDIGRVAGPWS